MKEDIEEILDCHYSMITGQHPIHPHMTLEEARDALLTLFETKLQEAIEFTLKTTHSIEYPPSGKTWYFQDNEWRNLLSMATEYILEQLEKGKE